MQIYYLSWPDYYLAVVSSNFLKIEENIFEMLLLRRPNMENF